MQTVLTKLWFPPKTNTPGRLSLMVDGDHATEWLKLNIERNRHVRAKQVDKLTRDINAGRFVYDGSPIRFDRNGRLIDGQHRLRAIAAASPEALPVKLDVVYGLAESTFDTLDCGITRTASDMFTSGGMHNTKTLAAVATILLDWDEERGLVTRAIKRSHAELALFVAENPLAGEAVARTCNHRTLSRMCAPSIVATATFLFMRIDRNATEMFLDSLEEGANIPAGDGRLLLMRVLRNYKTKGRRSHSSTDKENFLALWIKAWNLWRSGQTASLLVYKGDEPFPLPV